MPDIVGHRHHLFLWRYASESPWILVSRGHLLPHPPPTAGIFAGPLPAPLLLVRGAYAGAAVSGLAHFPSCTYRNCPCCAARGSPFPDVGRLGHAGKCPGVPRDRRGGCGIVDSHPGATIQMKLRPRRALTEGATFDVIGRRHHFARGWYSSEPP